MLRVSGRPNGTGYIVRTWSGVPLAELALLAGRAGGALGTGYIVRTWSGVPLAELALLAGRAGGALGTGYIGSACAVLLTCLRVVSGGW